MIKKFPVNKRIPIAKIGNSFTIRKKDITINKIEFSEENKLKLKSYTIGNSKDVIFDINKMKTGNEFNIIPSFIEFKTERPVDFIELEIN